MHVDKSNNIENTEEHLSDYYELTETMFYPPEDTRLYTSGIDDIKDGDTFAEYAEYFWEVYGHEIYDESDLQCF